MVKLQALEESNWTCVCRRRTRCLWVCLRARLCWSSRTSWAACWSSTRGRHADGSLPRYRDTSQATHSYRQISFLLKCFEWLSSRIVPNAFPRNSGWIASFTMATVTPVSIGRELPSLYWWCWDSSVAMAASQRAGRCPLLADPSCSGTSMIFHAQQQYQSLSRIMIIILFLFHFLATCFYSYSVRLIKTTNFTQ